MILYKTVKEKSVAEQIIEKSRFIAHVSPIESKAEGEAFIADIRRKHRDATHNVPCMVLGDKMQVQWASDDGEPRGTAGPPILQMLVNSGITNVCIVVTRYFGGIKLGTGGLVRAYTGSAKLGLDVAGTKEVKEMFHIIVQIDYTFLSVVENMVKQSGFEIIHVDYADKVLVEIVCDVEENALLKRQIGEITSGKVKIVDEYQKIS